MFLLPYLAGVAATPFSEGSWLRVTLGVAGIVSLFMARAPVMRIARRRRRTGDRMGGNGDYWNRAAAFTIAGIVALGLPMFLYGYWQMLTLALVAGVITVAQTWLGIIMGERSLPAELTGVLLLAMTAPLGVYLAGGGSPWREAGLSLWIVNASYYGATVFSVKMKVAATTRRRGRMTARERLSLARSSLIYLAAMLALWMSLALAGLVPALSPMALLPLIAYTGWSIVTLGSRLKIRTEGFTQLALALVFTLAVIVIWRIG